MRNFAVRIYALFPQIFGDWKVESTDFFTFRMYRCRCESVNVWKCALGSSSQHLFNQLILQLLELVVVESIRTRAAPEMSVLHILGPSFVVDAWGCRICRVGRKNVDVGEDVLVAGEVIESVGFHSLSSEFLSLLSLEFHSSLINYPPSTDMVRSPSTTQNDKKCSYMSSSLGCNSKTWDVLKCGYAQTFMSYEICMKYMSCVINTKIK